MPSEFHTENKSSSTDEGNNLAAFLIHKGKYFIIRKVKVGIRWHVRKELSEEFKNSELHRNLLRKEFEVGQQLEHPNIVRYLFILDDSKGLYVFMDFIEGKTLQSILDNINNSLYLNNTQFNRKLITDLANAFSHIHSRGIIHGDVTPSNIIYNNEQNKFYLIDFGFASSANFINIGGGTKLFASPESFLSPNKINASSDIYSFGKILETLVNTQGTLVYKSLIKKCTVEVQEERFQNFGEIIEALKKNKKHKVILLLSIIVSCITILFIGIFFKAKNAYSNTESLKPKLEKISNIDVSSRKKEHPAFVTEKKKVKTERIEKKKSAPPIIWTDTVVKNFGFLKSFEERLATNQVYWDMATMRKLRIQCIVALNRQYEAFLAASSYSNKEKQMIQDAYIKKYLHEYQKSDTIMLKRLDN